jgi:hypothetical protein
MVFVRSGFKASGVDRMARLLFPCPTCAVARDSNATVDRRGRKSIVNEARLSSLDGNFN